MPLETGTTFGPHSVTVKIGEGGMGEAYLVGDTNWSLPAHVDGCQVL